jgi:hypothetical protein
VFAAGLVWARSGQLPVRLFAGGFALLLILNPAKHEYRMRAWWSGDKVTPLDSAVIWMEALEATYTGQQDEAALAEHLEATSSRMSVLGQVGQVFEWVPDRVPWAGPEKWLQVPNLLIPRVLWRDKPIQENFFNRNYTVAFNIQSPRTMGMTSITLPAVADGYWRLGWLGVLIEGLLVGLIMGTAQGISRVDSLANLLVAASMVIVRTDYHVFGHVTGIIQQVCVALIVAWATDRMASLATFVGAPPAQALPKRIQRAA